MRLMYLKKLEIEVSSLKCWGMDGTSSDDQRTALVTVLATTNEDFLFGPSV